MYAVLIVEDDVREAEVLRSHLRRFGKERDVEFKITWLSSAFDLIKRSAHSDLVFLDIGLPGISGMEAAQMLRLSDETKPIVFVTNLAQYAVKGYEVDASDFIVKPVTYRDFALRMGKLLRRLELDSVRRIVLSTLSGTKVISRSLLEYVEVKNHSLSFYVVGEESPLLGRGSLKEFEQLNGAHPLLRISKSVLVNMERIEWVRGREIRLIGGTTLHINRSYKRDASERIARYLGGR